MMQKIQQTSKEAFKDIQPKVKTRHTEILNALESLGEATDSEIAFFLGKEDPNYVRPRRWELVNELKLVCYSRKRTCRISRKMVLAWKLIEVKNE